MLSLGLGPRVASLPASLRPLDLFDVVHSRPSQPIVIVGRTHSIRDPAQALRRSKVASAEPPT